MIWQGSRTGNKMEITEATVKNIINEEFKHHWEIGLPQHCEKTNITDLIIDAQNMK